MHRHEIINYVRNTLKNDETLGLDIDQELMKGLKLLDDSELMSLNNAILEVNAALKEIRERQQALEAELESTNNFLYRGKAYDK